MNNTNLSAIVRPFIGKNIDLIPAKDREMLNSLILPNGVKHACYSPLATHCGVYTYNVYSEPYKRKLSFLIFPSLTQVVTPSQSTIKVTTVTSDIKWLVTQYLWKNKIYLGLVSNFVDTRTYL